MKIMVQINDEGDMATVFRRPMPWRMWLAGLTCVQMSGYINVQPDTLGPVSKSGDQFEIEGGGVIIGGVAYQIEPITVRASLVYAFEHGVYLIFMKGWTWTTINLRAWQKHRIGY